MPHEPPVFSEPVYSGAALSQLKVEGQNIIQPWGVEFADSSAFYSLEEGFGYRYEMLSSHISSTDSVHEVSQTIRMREGLVRLELREELCGPREIRRTAMLTCLEDTTLMDFVLRYRFQASIFSKGRIAGRELSFGRSNINHQYPVNSAELENERYRVRVTAIDSAIPNGMKAYMYLRDGEDAWILHARMLPETWDREVIKLCSRYFRTRPLPRWLSLPILTLPGVRENLWYRGERKPYKNSIAQIFSPNAFPMARLQKGQALRWEAACTISAMTDKAA